jgi:putative ABC transport system permease protein
MRKLLRRLTHWLQRDQADRDLRDEMELHRAMEQERLERGGMSAKEARYASRRALGNVTLAAERSREVWLWPSLERLVQDFRYGLRMLRRQPMFAATAILTLALGIGATTAVFSIVEFEMWKPLPFPKPDRLVAIYTSGVGPQANYQQASPPEVLEFRAQTGAFVDLAASGSRTRRVLRGGDVADSLTVGPVTSNYFSVLGRGAALGRTFGPEDDRAPNVLLLTDACWRRSFDADPNVIGRTITLNDVSHTIVGVLVPGAFEYTALPDAFVAMPLNPGHDRTDRTLGVIGRMKDGVAIPTAEADLRVLTQRMALAYPTLYQGRGVQIEGLRESSTGFSWRLLFFFLGAAIFVLLLTCVNVANLLLARALRRDREFAIRRALGGGRAALARQLIVEGALLAFPGGALGLLLALWVVDAVPAWIPQDFLARGTEIVLDYRVFVFAVAVSAVTALLFGLAPALLTSGRDLNPLLVQGSRTLGGSPRQRRARHALVVVEMMIALVLLVGAGLFLTSYARLLDAPLGFDPVNRVTMRITLAGSQYPDDNAAVPFSERLLETIRAVPGVRDAAVGNAAPFGASQGIRFARSDKPAATNADDVTAIIRTITPQYMRTLGIRITSGREFTDRDVNGAPSVAVINEQLARRFFPGEDPIGQDLELISDARTRWLKSKRLRIVGVIANIKNVSINEVDFYNIFVPLPQHPVSTLQLIAHTSVPAANVVDQLRQAATSLDKSLPVLGVQTMTQTVSNSLRGARFNLLLIVMFGGLAMVMAAIGIYGTMSYAMEQRIQEFGIRLALGAQRSGILRLALGQAAWLGGLGMVCGLALSLVVARLIGDALYLVPRVHSGVLFGVTTTDPFTLTIACFWLLTIAVIAGLVPARRAMSVDPVIALRAE